MANGNATIIVGSAGAKRRFFSVSSLISYNL